MTAQLIQLPWYVLLTLSCGYVGYFMAHVGIRSHHKTVDVAFTTLVFGLFAAGVYKSTLYVLGGADHDLVAVIISSMNAFLFTFLLGGGWSWRGRNLFLKYQRWAGISYADDLPSAWKALFRVNSFDGKQLSVELTDGTWLFCEDLHRFKDEPNGPCVLGGVGDVLMYVTHVKSKGDQIFTECSDVQMEDWGARISYIPREKIARLEFRRR